MATFYSLHPETPQQRSLDKLVAALRSGAVMLYPTDTVWAIGCDFESKAAVQRVRQIKQLSNDKPLTFLCPSLSNIATYATVSDTAYKIMRRLVPGPYTFLLPATKVVPRLVLNPKRKTVGIRVPDNRICQALLETLGHPVISTSAPWPEDEPAPEVADLHDRFEKIVDAILDSGTEPGTEVSTIIDLTGDTPEIVREGLGYEEAARLV